MTIQDPDVRMRQGIAIKMARVKAGMLQEQLARRVGKSQKMVSWWETGKGSPRWDELLLLAEALGINVKDLADAGSMNSDEMMELLHRNAKPRAKVEILQDEIRKLPPEERRELFRWMALEF